MPQLGAQEKFWMAGGPNETTAKFIGYGGARGGGKAIINSYQIRTRNGKIITHGTARPGDMIANPFGGEQMITEIHPQGVVPTLVFKFKDVEEPVICSRDHLWNFLLISGDENTPYVAQTADYVHFLHRRSYKILVPLDGMKDWIELESVGHGETAEATCITVENHHGLYVLENAGIVTHNSFGLRSFIITMLSQMPLQACIVRQTLEDLKKNHIQPMSAELASFMRGKTKVFVYNQQDRRLMFPNGSSLQFMYCKTDQDLNRFQGQAFDIMGIEEAGQFTQFQISYMISSNRPSPVAITHKSPFPVKCMMTFNWGGPGHHYLRRIYVDKNYLPELETPEHYKFIPAKIADNPALALKDPDYVKRLMLLPEKLRRAYIDGDPDAFTGTMFNVVDIAHLVDQQELLSSTGGVIPRNWGLFGALDPGSASPCSFGLYAKTQEGQIYKILNYYVRDRNVEDHAIKIKEAIATCQYTEGRMPDYITAGADAFARQQRYAIRAHDVTWQDVFRDHGMTLVRAAVGAGSRRASCMALLNLLDYKYDFENDILVKPPRLRFFTGTCNPTLDELKALERSQTDPEDIQQGDGILDHAYDETRYAIMAAVAPHMFNTDPDEPINPKVDYGRQLTEQNLGFDMEYNKDDGGWETYFG